MKTKFYQIALLCLAFLGMASLVNAQTLPGSYDPFTLNKATLSPGDAVPGSYLRYQVAGDQDFGVSTSTFVWYVEGGQLGTYSADVWTPIVAGSLTDVGTGKTTILTGGDVDGTKNSSEIWVKWDDDMTQGYIAVYEVSPNGCIADNTITGFNVSKLNVVNALFTQATSEGCSADNIALSVELSIDPDATNWEKYYPLTLDYTIDGVDASVEIAAGDVSIEAPYTYNLDINPNNTVAAASTDDVHAFILVGIKDKNNAPGTFSGITQHDVTIHHLPQTGTMAQN